jgi:hypothetical protein
VEWIGGEVRPADSCSGEALVARACWREKWCGGIGVVTALLYEVEGRQDGTDAVGGGHTGGRHYHSVGGFGGRPFPGEEEAGAVWGGTVECSAHWREGEAARGGGSTPTRAARAAMGEKGIGWGLKTALTGGLHLSAARESERGVAGWLALGGPAAVFGLRGEKNMLG